MRATQVGLKVRELQLQLPSARIVYCSATGASGEPRRRPAQPGSTATGLPLLLGLLSSVAAPSFVALRWPGTLHTPAAPLPCSVAPDALIHLLASPALARLPEPRNMGYMVRLGLWGDGNPAFRDFGRFLDAVQVQVGAAECAEGG